MASGQIFSVGGPRKCLTGQVEKNKTKELAKWDSQTENELMGCPYLLGSARK
jgi:hypothetical protein